MVEDMVEVPDSAGRPAGEVRSPAPVAADQVV
jgi:hypothetical protein